MINLAAWLPRSHVNGPGCRAVLWVQGCPLPLCPGCFNPAFLDVDKVAEQISPDDLSARILAVEGLRGVTFSGGEPFHQAKALSLVAQTVRRAGRDVVIFTGHTLEALRRSPDPGVAALLAQTDLLVAGPYRAQQPCDEPLRSSENQKLHFLGQITPEDLYTEATVEVTLDVDGAIRITGFPVGALGSSLRR